MNLGDENMQLLLNVVGGTVIVSVVGYVTWRRCRKAERKEYPKDTVIHHQIGRGPHAPSATPFALKLETYLRMAKIPYLNVHDAKMSKKGKLTWIEYNGEDVADSEFCIEYLNEKLGIDLDKDFTPRDRGTARAFQKMIEENTYWAGLLERWIYDESRTYYKILKIPFFVGMLMRRQLKKNAESHGMGRHSQEEVYHIMDSDLKAISDYIGKNKFLLGDTPCQEDCAIFGLLGTLYWHGFGMRGETYIKKYTNLCDYCERMK